MSGVYLLFCLVLIYHVVHQTGWLLHTLLILSLSVLILAVQPYKKSYMDGLLLALLGFLTLLIVTFLYIQPSASESLSLIFVIACGLPHLVLLLSVTYRQLKGKQIARYVAGKITTLLKWICKRNQVGDELSDADSLPHRLINLNQYNRPLVSDTEQAHINQSETLTVRGQVQPVYTYGSVS